jgi:hypothetical protein
MKLYRGLGVFASLGCITRKLVDTFRSFLATQSFALELIAVSSLMLLALYLNPGLLECPGAIP